MLNTKEVLNTKENIKDGTSNLDEIEKERKRDLEKTRERCRKELENPEVMAVFERLKNK